MKTSGIEKVFFEKKSSQYFCILCSNGQCEVQFQRISDFFEQSFKSNKQEECNKDQCGACGEKFAESYCLNCSQFYCLSCEEIIHANNKSFFEHKICSYQEKLEMFKPSKQCHFSCNCSLKNELEVFCLDCYVAICKRCFNDSHASHSKTFLGEMISESKKLNYKEIKDCLNQMFSDFESYKKNLVSKVEEDLEFSKKELERVYESILAMLNDMKKKQIEKIYGEFQHLKSQLSLLENSFVFLIKELEEVEYNDNKNFHPNKHFQIQNIFPHLLHHVFEGFDVRILDNEKILPIKNILSLSEQETTKYLSLIGANPVYFLKIPKIELSEIKKLGSKTPSTIDYLFENFNSYPPDLLKQRLPVVLDTVSFQQFFTKECKSSNSTSFMMNGDTFVVWPGLQKSGNNIFSVLHIYNLSQSKMANKILGSIEGAYINVIATYPKHTNYDSKKWLYTGDSEGDLRVYNIERNQKQFEKIFKLPPKLPKTGILSTIIFDDTFNELDSRNSGIYMFISYDDEKMKLYLYEFKEKEKILKFIRAIDNTFKKKCATINFCHDEKKTLVFFGFTNKAVIMYDLKSSTWVKEFPSTNMVTSINFMTKIIAEKKERSMIYTEDNEKNNSIKIVDFDTWKIKKNIIIESCQEVHDICIWNSNNDKKQFLVASCEYIYTVDLENMSAPCANKTQEWLTMNLIKVLKKDMDGKSFIEGVVACQINKESECRVAFYQEFKKKLN